MSWSHGHFQNGGKEKQEKQQNGGKDYKNIFVDNINLSTTSQVSLRKRETTFLVVDNKLLLTTKNLTIFYRHTPNF